MSVAENRASNRAQALGSAYIPDAACAAEDRASNRGQALSSAAVPNGTQTAGNRLAAPESPAAARSLHDEVLGRLAALAEPAYRDFSGALVPGKTLLGVRLPAVRALAREYRGRFAEVWEALLPCGQTLEEDLFLGFLLASAKLPFAERLERFAQYLPRVDSWSACDSTCMAMKSFAKNPEQGLAFAQSLARSPREFDVRAGAVLMLAHFIDPAHLFAVLGTLGELSDGRLTGKYYAQMAVAWAYSVAFVKHPTCAERALDDIRDPLILRKTIAKTLESLRASAELKAFLRTYRDTRRENAQ